MNLSSILFLLLTILKFGIVIFFIIRIVKKLINKKGVKDPFWRALLQFLIMCGLIAGITIIEFGLAFILPTGN